MKCSISILTVLICLLSFGCEEEIPQNHSHNEFYDYNNQETDATVDCAVLTHLVVSLDSFDYSLSLNLDKYPFPTAMELYDSLSRDGNKRNYSVELFPFMLINYHKYNSSIPCFEIWDAFVYERGFYPNGPKIGLEYLDKGVALDLTLCRLERRFYDNNNDMSLYPIDTVQANRNKVKIICTGDTLGLAEIESDFRARQIETFIIPYYMILVTFHHREEFCQPLIDLLEKYAPHYPQARKLLDDYK